MYIKIKYFYSVSLQNSIQVVTESVILGKKIFTTQTIMLYLLQYSSPASTRSSVTDYHDQFKILLLQFNCIHLPWQFVHFSSSFSLEIQMFSANCQLCKVYIKRQECFVQMSYYNLFQWSFNTKVFTFKLTCNRSHQEIG